MEVDIKNFELSKLSVQELGGKLSKLLTDNPDQKFYVNVTQKKKNRSLSANAQQHVWYKQISEFTNTDIKTCEAESKIDFGLPVILSDPEIGKVIGHALQSAKFFTMTREKQVKFVQVIQVSSLMSTKQHNQYRDNIQYYWNQQGLDIGYDK